jgi:cupin-like protein
MATGDRRNFHYFYFLVCGVIKRILALLLVPFDYILGRYKKIPYPPPYMSPFIRIQYEFLWQYRWVKKKRNALSSLENKLHEKLLEHSKKYGLGPTIPLPRIQAQDIDPKSWSYIYEGYPVIFDGLLKDSEAVKNWSFDYLKMNYGNTKVNVRRFGRKHDPYDTGSEMVGLSKAIDEIRNNGSMYPSASSNLFKENPKLLYDLNLDKIEGVIKRSLSRAEVFIGGAQNISTYHAAPGGNMFCQIHGEKKWILVSPRHSMWIYSEIGFVSGGRFFFSPVISDEDEDIEIKYPLYKYIPKYTAHLKPGDVLYNPPWWWHEVRNVNETIGVPLRIPSIDDVNHLANLFLYSWSPSFKENLIPQMKKAFAKKGYEDLVLSDDYSQNLYKGNKK